MRLRLFAALVCLCLFMLAAVEGSPKAASPASFIKGTYNCQLSGGFIGQPNSTALMQFTVNGKGGVTSASGEFNVMVGQLLFFAPQATPTPVPLGQFSSQSCNYAILGSSPGIYSFSQNGSGTLTISWTPTTISTTGAVDCTEQISTNFDVLVTSPASLMLKSTDSFNSNCFGAPTYQNCGSTLAGTCQQQAAKP